MKAVIADDHEIFRSGLHQLLIHDLGCGEVLEAGNLPDALELIERERPIDISILDLWMPGMDGIDGIAAMCSAAAGMRVVIMSASEARLTIFDALSAGIDGYVPKTLPVVEIVLALRHVLSGHIYVPKLSARDDQGDARMQRLLRGGAGLEGLTERQRDVLGELLSGKSSKEIGRTLGMAEATVKIHLAAIYRALGVHSRSAAIARVSAKAR
jgi:DNA-binding NarL/FixJ family response regulator